MLVKLIDSFSTGIAKLRAAFIITDKAECAICHKTMVRGQYATHLQEFKYCNECKPFHKVLSVTDLRTDPLGKIPSSVELPDTEEHIFNISTQGLDNITQMELYKMQVLGRGEYEQLIQQHSPLLNELSPTATPRNVIAIRIRLNTLTNDEIMNIDTIRLPVSRGRRHLAQQA